MRNAARTRRARFVVPCRRPRRPRHRPRQQSCHGLCFMPRRSRAFHAAPAPRQALAQAGCRVSREAASVVSRLARLLRVCDRLPTGSFSSSSSHGPSGRPSSPPPPSRFALRRDRSARLEIVWLEATCDAADLSRHSPQGDGGLAALFPARAREERGEKSVSAPRRGLWQNQPCPPATQWTPAACRVCRPRNSESTLRMPPPGKRPDAATSAMPPGSPRPVPSRTSRPSCLPCRHVAAFQTSAHPPPFSRPRPVGPKRKARSQKPDAVLVNCGCIRLLTASFSCSGRKPSASIVPPWPWPCRPTPARRPACRSRYAAA
jgi:hypothetical protein